MLLLLGMLLSYFQSCFIKAIYVFLVGFYPMLKAGLRLPKALGNDSILLNLVKAL